MYKTSGMTCGIAIFIISLIIFAKPSNALELKAMPVGLGSGTITSDKGGLSCGNICDIDLGSIGAIELTAQAANGSKFVEWIGDCSGTNPVCNLGPSFADRSIRARFELDPDIPILNDLTPDGIKTYLAENTHVNSPARFIKALPPDMGFRKNWILMSRSESLQTGTAKYPRIILSNTDASAVFSIGIATHTSYPASHPNAIEYMQWEGGDEKNFRFHEIVVNDIPGLPEGTSPPKYPPREPGISIDDTRCSLCHSTNNVLNNSSFPGTDGKPPRTLKVKNKPNWDTYDSWGGMLSFNRDRLYQGSVETEAFRKIMNPWTWRENSEIRAIIEQLKLQPDPTDTSVTHIVGGPSDGVVRFSFDGSQNQFGDEILVDYSFDGKNGTPPGTEVKTGGNFVTLHHALNPSSDEGRGVHLFDILGGAKGFPFNQERIVDEIINHEFATGSFPIEVRPVTLAIVEGCFIRNEMQNKVVARDDVDLTVDLSFFDERNGATINELVGDTAFRTKSVPRRKSDIQRLNLDRTSDPYLSDDTEPKNGLIQEYGDATTPGQNTDLSRIRQEVFQRPVGNQPDQTVMGGIIVDREDYGFNTERVTLFRYFLEPLGLSVDKWSMGVRGRSRTYSFADVFGSYIGTFRTQLVDSLKDDPVANLKDLDDLQDLVKFECDDLVTATNITLANLPKVKATPTYTDIQRIFNRSCIECHGGLDYPPASADFGVSYLNLAEDEEPPAGDRRLTRSHRLATSLATATDPQKTTLMRRITDPSEDCPYGMMPCGGPPLSLTDIKTIERWILGSNPNTEGDPHIKTVDGTHYDFQSAGEFVLLRDESLEIQTRQVPVSSQNPLRANPHSGLSSCVSLNSAVAVKAGSQRITYQPSLNSGSQNRLQLRVDGELVDLDENGFPLASGGSIMPTNVADGIQIQVPGGTDIVVTPSFWNARQLWYMNVNVRRARGTEGIMGTISRGQWLPALPDGSLLGARPEDLEQRYIDLYQTFADAWRVSDESSLFDYAAGTSTDTFTDRNWPSFQPDNCLIVGTGPIQPPLPEDIAEQECSAIVDSARRENCKLDVMVTGEIDFAQTYLETEQIQHNQLPSAPELLSPEDDLLDLDSSIEFTWTASSDPDGDPISYQHCIWPLGETMMPNHCEALGDGALSQTVSGLEPGKAYTWKVIVQDDNNGTTHSETRRFKTKFINTWTVGVAYEVGDRVIFNGIEYVCIQAHTAQGDWQPNIVPALWSRVIAGDAWQPQTAYTSGQVVTFAGDSYECLQSHTSLPGWEPSNVPSLWHKL